MLRHPPSQSSLPDQAHVRVAGYRCVIGGVMDVEKIDSESNAKIRFYSTYRDTKHDTHGRPGGDPDIFPGGLLDKTRRGRDSPLFEKRDALLFHMWCRRVCLHLKTQPLPRWIVKVVADLCLHTGAIPEGRGVAGTFRPSMLPDVPLKWSKDPEKGDPACPAIYHSAWAG